MSAATTASGHPSAAVRTMYPSSGFQSSRGRRRVRVRSVPVRAPGALAHHLPQPLALVLVLDALRHPDRSPARHVEQVAGRDRHVRGEARALGAERILDDLHPALLAVVHQIGDRRPVAQRRRRRGLRRGRRVRPRGRGVVDLPCVRIGDVRCVQERRPVQPDVDECGLHAGKDPAYPALVDVAHEPATVGALDEDLLERAALDQRDPGLARSDVDQQFGAHGSKCPAGSGPRRLAVPPAVRRGIRIVCGSGYGPPAV